MKRTLIQLDEDTYRLLREQAFRQERSISSLVREFIASGLKARRPTEPRRFSSVGAGRSVQGRLAPVSEKHDEALASVKKR